MKRTAKMLTAALLALTLALPGTAAAADDTPAVRISEMMYKNHATLQDADGDFSDWFELENTTNRVVRLKGWSVSDGKTVWDFPADATIPRGGVRVVFASRKDTTVSGELHTSFALGEGETLYLIAPGGTIADRAACDPELPADHVLRRENGGELTESVWATPGYPNTAAGYAAFCESRKTESPLVIYEAAVYNDTFALKGEYYDWVEIKNVSKESVKLSDYCLSDDRREPEKWSLPNRTLAKGQSILIYCTGEENPTTGNGLRANFALNASSETLYLTKKGESAPADFVWLHDIPYGYSMGRTDAENGFFYLRRQTPNMPNKTDAYRYISEAPAANREPGVYEAGRTVRVKLAAAGDIYYTTDGSAPTEESTPYTGAITVDKTTVLRAVAVEEGGAPSPALTLSFFIGEEHTLPVLSLVTDSPRRFSEIYEGSVKDRECAGNLSFYAPEGSFSIGCGVEMKGHTSLFAPKKSLGVSFRGCYGAETLACDIFGEGPAEFSELSIRAGQDYSSTVFRNELMQELCAELDTTVTQRSRYCVLYINGEYWGIYCLKDDITRQYYANLTGTAKEDVTMLSSPVPQSAAVYTEALGLWKDTSLTREEAYERFCAAVDMDGFIDWVLLEGYCANGDVKSNLRYFRTGDGPWQIAFYDLDWAFQSRYSCFLNLVGPEQTAQIAPTIRWLFGIDGFKERLLTRYADLTETTLSDGHVTEKIDEFRALLAPEMARERARWSGTAGAWEESVDALRANIADGYAAHTVRNLCSILGVGEEERMEHFGF